MLTRTLKLLLLTSTLLVCSSAAHAALEVYITGTPGSGQTTWEFRGSSVAGLAGFFEDGIGIANDDAWQNIGDYTTLNDQEITTVVGSATLTIAGVTRNIDEAYIDNDGSGTPDDDFGVGVDGATNFTFVAGNTISWTGSLVVTGIDLNDVDETALPTSFTTDNYGGAPGTLAMTVFIGTAAPSLVAAAIPSLSKWALLLLILSLGFVGYRMQRKVS